jgi:hypothetical protein
MTTDPAALLDAALEWAAQGVPVFPVARDKRPLTRRGHLDASTDPDAIRSMFAQAGARCYGIGARMGKDAGLFAIDADLYKPDGVGDEAKAWVESLQARGFMPPTRTHATLSGGVHYIYSSTTAWPNVKPCDGVEVKGEGGYIVVPPTLGYRVEREGVVAAPEGLVSALTAARAHLAAQPDADLEAVVLSGASFHDPLTQLAARLASRMHSPDVIRDKLLALLAASSARIPEHPRHARWQKMVTDEGKEFSRLCESATAKFDPLAPSRGLAAALGHLVPQAPPQPSPDPARPPEWPFADRRGYFGAQLDGVLDQKFVMHPILVEGETTLISAAPKAGKTLVAETLAMHLAAGFDLGNLLVAERRPVIYFALESQIAIRKRLMAWKLTHDPHGEIFTDANFQMFVCEAPLNLLNVETRADTAARVAMADRWFQERGAAPLGLVVIDTLTKAMPGGDQNSVEDTSAVFHTVELIRQAGVTAAIMIVHHNTKHGNAPRGSSNIQAEPDTLLTLDKDEDGLLHLSVLLARSIEDTEKWVFRVDSYDLGVTEQGYKITAPVLRPGLARHKDADDTGLALADARAFLDIYKAIADLGPGRHQARKVHAFLTRSLGSTSYKALSALRPLSPEWSKAILAVIPVHGARTETGLVVSSLVQRQGPASWIVTGFEVISLEAYARPPPPDPQPVAADDMVAPPEPQVMDAQTPAYTSRRGRKKLLK